MPRYMKVGHVHLNVTDLERSLAFYTEMMGFHVAARRDGDKAWLNFGQYPPEETRSYHELALTEVPYRNQRYWETSGLNHVAYELATPAEVRDFAAELRAKGVEIFRGPATHKGDETYHIYVRDPDGNAVEIYAKTSPEDAEFRTTIEAAVPPGYNPDA